MFSLATCGLREGAMSEIWRNIIAIASQNSFVSTVLFVVCLACIFAFVFEATIDIVVAIVILGCVTAVSEHVMHSRNDR
jgi:Na+/citrate or Na+/malate symporter